MGGQLDHLGKRVEHIKDTKKAERIGRQFYSVSVREIAERLKPEIFDRIKAKTEIGKIGNQCQEQLESLQKEADALYEELFGKQSRLSPELLTAAFTINTSVQSLNIPRQLGGTTEHLNRSIERLDSGLRIRAADDAEGLAVSESMRVTARSLSQALRNTADGISLVQTAESAAIEVGNILSRMRELAVQSANGTYSTSDRRDMDTEFQQLSIEITRIAENAPLFGQSLRENTAGTFLGTSVATIQDAGQAAVKIDDAVRNLGGIRVKLVEKAKEDVRPCEEEANKMRLIFGEIKAHYKTKKV